MGEWVTIREATRLLGVSDDTVRRRIARSELQSRRDGQARNATIFVELPDGLPDSAEPSSPSMAAPGPSLGDVIPPERIMVPVDAWTRMLDQLGNLHAAGQELAEARERAAKAETTSDFLREQLREARERLERAETAATGSTGPEAHPAPVEPQEPSTRRWSGFLDRWRR